MDKWKKTNIIFKFISWIKFRSTLYFTAKATLGILIPDLKKQTEPNQDIHDLSVSI